MRKVLIGLIVLILVIAGVYFFYIRPKMNSGEPVPNVISSFFPKVTSNGNAFGPDDTPVTPDGTAATAANNPLKQLTSRPVAGYTVFNIATKVSIPSTDPKGKPTIQTNTDYYLRYVSRINGYVYEMKNGSAPLQISNILIPNIYEAVFADNNNTALLRFLRADEKTIATYSVPIPGLNDDGTRTQKPGIYLQDNIYSLAVSPDQTHIARITTDSTGSLVTSSTSTGTTIKTLFRSPFQSWLPQWNTTSVYLQTKAASTADGYLYSIDQASSRLKRILGNIKGFTASVSPSGTYVIYSETVGNTFRTRIFNTKTNAISPLSIDVLPEKCTWLKNEDLVCAGNSTVQDAVYPDAWYAGIMHFSDQLYRISPTTNSYSVLYDGSDASFDMTNIQVDEGQGYAYFIDKNTGILWQYKY